MILFGAWGSSKTSHGDPYPESRWKDEEFKVVLSYVKFEASLGYMRLHLKKGFLVSELGSGVAHFSNMHPLLRAQQQEKEAWGCVILST